ncbi:hypothetical protein FNH22_18850 [Fulvivirga sp. M361]|uniref:hypothetical protein n=1 Tax=Fulvivirga sp. M361 TaxID=2594266 RepID=UPI00117ABA6A|nr:hypothetical protein [Fulvivirga sp. M361]TRX54814.1 hypothetical protein FNH22_18850 [Fulvivirga sp. M361]
MEKPQIYKLESHCTEKKENDFTKITEVFLISNAPKEEYQLKDFIEVFNQVSRMKDCGSDRNIIRIRNFYYETKELNKDFKDKNPEESGYFEKVDLAHYSSEKFYESYWISGKYLSGYNTSYIKDKVGETNHYKLKCSK